MITIGSIFSGIGGFERGAEMAFKKAGLPCKTIWQIEKDKFCQKVLKKHWPKTKLYPNITKINTNDIIAPDIICAGFPCQDISRAGQRKGIHNGQKSSLYWDAWRMFCNLRPQIIVLENVSNLLRVGGSEVLGSLAELGYNVEWATISARQSGAPHRRNRIFIVAYSDGYGCSSKIRRYRSITDRQQKRLLSKVLQKNRTEYNCGPTKDSKLEIAIQPSSAPNKSNTPKDDPPRGSYWKEHSAPPPLCRVDDGVSDRLHRIKALGNAIVPQCAEYVFECIIKSNLLKQENK